MTVRELSGRSGIQTSTLFGIKRGQTPQGKTLERLEAWIMEEGGGADREESPEDAVYDPAVGGDGYASGPDEAPTADYLARHGRTLLVRMESDGIPLIRRRGAWIGFRTTLTDVLGTVPQWWYDEYEKLGGTN